MYSTYLMEFFWIRTYYCVAITWISFIKFNQLNFTQRTSSLRRHLKVGLKKQSYQNVIKLCTPIMTKHVLLDGLWLCIYIIISLFNSRRYSNESRLCKSLILGGLRTFCSFLTSSVINLDKYWVNQAVRCLNKSLSLQRDLQ